MKPKISLAFALLSISFLLNSCVKKDLINALENGKDCQVFYQSQKKIKKIEAASFDGITKTSEFTYTNNVISTITVNGGTQSAENYAIVYASGICLPSGFTYTKLEPHMLLYGAFTIEKTKIIKRVLTPDFSDPYNNSESNKDFYVYDFADRVILDRPGFSGSPGYDLSLNASYRPDGNVQEYNLGRSSHENIITIDMDKRNNPFKQQNHLFYLMKFLPFASFPGAIDDVWHYFSLNLNNPLKLYHYNRFDEVYEYTFEYTYTADGYPTNIKVYKAYFQYGPNYPPTPRELQEQLTITYL